MYYQCLHWCQLKDMPSHYLHVSAWILIQQWKRNKPLLRHFNNHIEPLACSCRLVLISPGPFITSGNAQAVRNALCKRKGRLGQQEVSLHSIISDCISKGLLCKDFKGGDCASKTAQWLVDKINPQQLSPTEKVKVSNKKTSTWYQCIIIRLKSCKCLAIKSIQ